MVHPIKSLYVDLVLALALAGGGWALIKQIPENNPQQEQKVLAAILKNNQTTNLGQEDVRAIVRQELEPLASRLLKKLHFACLILV